MSISSGRAHGSSTCGRSEPDLRLIKQVEQVTISALEGPAWRFGGIPSSGITGAVDVLVFLSAITGLAVVWLQKQPGGAEGPFAKRQGRCTGAQACRPSTGLHLLVDNRDT